MKQYKPGDRVVLLDDQQATPSAFVVKNQNGNILGLNPTDGTEVYWEVGTDKVRPETPTSQVRELQRYLQARIERETKYLQAFILAIPHRGLADSISWNATSALHAEIITSLATNINNFLGNAGWTIPQAVAWLVDDLRRGAGRSGMGDADLFVHNVRMRAISVLLNDIEAFVEKP